MDSTAKLHHNNHSTQKWNLPKDSKKLDLLGLLKLLTSISKVTKPTSKQHRNSNRKPETVFLDYIFVNLLAFVCDFVLRMCIIDGKNYSQFNTMGIK